MISWDLRENNRSALSKDIGNYSGRKSYESQIICMIPVKPLTEVSNCCLKSHLYQSHPCGCL
jgi:hypothetical protein